MHGVKALASTGEREDARFLEELYANWQSRMLANPAYSIEDLRAIFEDWHKPALEPEHVTYRSVAIGGVPVILAMPPDPAASGSAGPDGGHDLVIYGHGGGFCVGSADGRRKLGGHLARHLRALVVIMDYRLAPEHPFPAAIEDSVAVYRSLRAERAGQGRILMAGDSAGGNLAIATVLRLRDLGEPLPAGIIAFSPWLDMEHTGPSLETNRLTDTLVNRAMLEGLATTYLAAASPTDPLANPLRADLTGLPPVYLNAGSSEALLSDTTRFAEAARRAGVDVTVSIAEGMQHVFPCLAGRARVADDELANVARWHRSRAAEGRAN